ncbi:uncharacterized protein LOC121237541 [Juglans microcarpa x Juglans regia]|uniref:uncharacterized protein LOC121237541 n=1 Tax=Juglans microcarpa x Juglans regia TaxID=2249226 RepID=UPI001B7ED18E|nr:uncharacterized protein LOC121237541 [Juglans microcarpa x Juglans regia]
MKNTNGQTNEAASAGGGCERTFASPQLDPSLLLKHLLASKKAAATLQEASAESRIPLVDKKRTSKPNPQFLTNRKAGKAGASAPKLPQAAFKEGAASMETKAVVDSTTDDEDADEPNTARHSVPSTGQSHHLFLCDTKRNC